jgi:predicted ArsR family transcriptional regulator
LPIREMRAIWHPTRARIFELLTAGPATRSQLAERVGAPYAEVAYHCRALCESGCIKRDDSPDPESGDPVFEIA